MRYLLIIITLALGLTACEADYLEASRVSGDD